MNRLASINLKLDKLNINGLHKIFALIDIIFTRLIMGANSGDYFSYRFYRRSFRNRLTFRCGRKQTRIYQTANGKNRSEIFDSKATFYRTFDNYISRDWIDVAHCSLEDFIIFSRRHNKAFAKPYDGTYGIGTKVIDLKENIDDKYEKLHAKGYIVEELIFGDPDIQAFNPSSLNTLRVVTLVCADGKPKLMFAGLRMGNGDTVADNLHHGGVIAMIDVDTGIIVTDGVDRDLNFYTYHPATNKSIKGFKIPKWNEIVRVAKEAALVVPEVRYVGWDIAVDRSGNIVIIEGNCCAGFDIIQMPDQEGKWYQYKDEIKKIAKLNKNKKST